MQTSCRKGKEDLVGAGEDPNLKHQAPENLQTPIDTLIGIKLQSITVHVPCGIKRDGLPLVAWNLEFLWSLVLGRLELLLRYLHRNSERTSTA
ncbi:MAG: hypothetical protein JWM68_2459 [Verrucomicrobiales bacterium]|nr:hypothetical protein [Verrucomicrobiales bacterium]